MDQLKPIREKKHPFWPYVLLVVVILSVFAKSCSYDFSWWDDWMNIQSNPWMNPPTWASVKSYLRNADHGLYVPVTYIVWLAIAAAGRLREPDPFGVMFNPWLFHAANLAIHTATSCLVFFFLSRLTSRTWPALAGALFWAIHPLQVETVCWVSGTKDLLAGCFQLAVLCRYCHRAQRAKDGEPISVLDFKGAILLLLALLSKPSAMTTPLLTCALDWLIIGRPLLKVLRGTFWWILIVLPFAVIARFAQTIPIDSHIAPIWVRPFIFSDAITFYLSKILVPIRLCVDYGRQWWVIDHRPWFYASALLIAGCGAAVYLARRRFPWLLAGSLIFVLSLLPVSGLTMFEFEQTSTTADHYVYVAMLGPALILAFILRMLPRRTVRTQWCYGIAGIALALLGVQSSLQNRTWQNDFTLFFNALAINPNSAMAHNNLASGYSMRGDMPDAIREYRVAIGIDRRYWIAHANLIQRLIQTHDVDGTIAATKVYLREYREANGADIHPAHLVLARLELTFGRNKEAIEECHSALQEDPASQEAAALLAKAQQKLAATQSTSQPSP